MNRQRPVALVTGGCRGIGLGIARALAARGFDLAIADLENDAAVIGELRGAGGRVAFFKSDLAAVETHEATISAIVAECGGIDCLVNNAGIGSVERGDFLGLKPENFDTIMGVNLRGTVFFTQAAVKAMLAAGDVRFPRSIVTISSVSSVMSSPERLDYCISKAGLTAFVQGLALRLAEARIGVFEVRPGIIRTDMTARVAGRYDGLIESGLVPMKRWGEVGDVGAIVAGLAGGDFIFATGSAVNADGGLSISRL
ncbi:NAD(P)-dependent dehydrogenase (short-subunit alcohol dehydrogenase family) [Ochrobactrum daejeonense]|uniref:NAD(P)-dependent dehydrogenase (Short-subunit alcohol dehydrogenase family) n=1 Tax=Brucella daejeonensis TaxID=659015 RepID=A0A7W9EJR0_9HYPH|nr:3-ketoacyl-ACP reductase [Brucella daejeonensis]MBB5700497.1 NAD(P)-dependent dehydrogenase (short-subunit alcohol dehydrogenase family) [Brucella daejeonensis]NKB78399.1 3-ketoacyl-ACP reductase [Brucella daejeonensis]